MKNEITSSNKATEIIPLLQELFLKCSEQSRTFIDLISEPLAIINNEKKIVLANKAFSELFYPGNESVSNRLLTDIADGVFVEKLLPFLQLCFEGETCKGESTYFYPSKIEKNLSLYFTPFQFHPDKETHVLLIVQDITELVKLNRKWQNTFNAINDIVLIISTENDIEDINDKGLKLLNKRKDEVIGQKCYNLFYGKQEVCNFCPFTKTMETGKPANVENYVKSYNQWFSLKSSPVYNSRGELKRYVEIMHDITLLKRSEEKIREINEEYLTSNEELTEANRELTLARDKAEYNEKQFSELFENMTQGFALHEMIYDNEGKPVDYKFILINKAFEKINQVKPEDLIGNRILEVLPHTEPFWIEKYGKVAKTGNPVRFTNYSKQFNKYFEVVAYSPRKNFFATIFSDITKTRQYEKDLIQASKQAREADRLKTAFLANMSHEIRTPMNGIIGFSELMTKDQLPDEKRKYYASIITNSSKQLLNIVNDVLDISRIESGIIKPEIQEFKLNNLINEAYQLFSQKSDNNNISLLKECPLDNTVTIKTDKVRLLQIFTNLLNNAFKFTTEGHVKLGYKPEQDKLLFFVEDTGRGISNRNLSKIFDRFWQEKTKLSVSQSGTGLGLSICKQLAEMLGGEIWAESQKGKGTLFTFTHPFSKIQSTPDHQENEKMLPEKAIKQELNILIADDEKINNIYIREILKESGLNPHFVENGKEAILFCEQNPDIHLVLMDIKMPVMDGEKAMKKIKQSRPDLLIIAFTAYAMDTDKERFMKNGFDGYLSKPYTRDQLLQLIERYRTVLMK